MLSAVIVDPPSQEAMNAVLQNYASADKRELVSKIAAGFANLFKIELDSGYTYGLREAISVTKDLELNSSLESALSNVFDYERGEEATQARAQIAAVFQEAGLPFDADAFIKGSLLEPGRVEIAQSASDKESLQDPKEGKSPDGTAHVGGNTWKGGTGGNSTAGLGGKHGPYRFDAGFDVHQVPDEEKKWTDPAAEERARKMAREALAARLKEISMSSGQFEAYESYRIKVAPQIASLRNVLNSLTTSSKSAHWKRGEMEGQLDEQRLVEALTGESNVFKRLVRSKSSVRGSGKVYIECLLDCSASMYRFQGHDRRLTRLMECTTLLMEAFDGVGTTRVELGISGHSGQDKRVQLLGDDSNKLPTTVKGRYEVLERIVAHTQYCWSGDSTFAAVGEAIRLIEKKGSDSDDRHVFVISDANFSRYNLSPARYASIAQENPGVTVTSIFVGSLGHEAEKLEKALAKGTSYVVHDTAELSGIFAISLRKAVAKQMM